MRFVTWPGFGAVISEKVSAMTNMPKFRMFSRIATGSLLSSR